MDLDWRPPPKLVNLQEKVDRGTLDLELSLDSYSGAPRGPRASPGPLLGLQSKVTNFMKQGSRRRIAPFDPALVPVLPRRSIGDCSIKYVSEVNCESAGLRAVVARHPAH